MFDWIGSFELIFILIIAGIVMGPKRIAAAANWLGRTTAYLQNVSRGFANQLKDELDAIDGDGDMKDMLREMQSLQKEVNSLRNQVTTTTRSAVAGVTGALSETQESLQEAQNEIGNSIRPPSFDEVDEVEDETAASVPTLNGSAETPETPPTLPNALTIDDDLE